MLFAFCSEKRHNFNHTQTFFPHMISLAPGPSQALSAVTKLTSTPRDNPARNLVAY